MTQKDFSQNLIGTQFAPLELWCAGIVSLALVLLWRNPFVTDGSVACVGPLMADKEQPPTVTGRVATELMEMARIVCAHTKDSSGKRLKLTDYLDSILRPAITKDHEEVMARIAHEQRTRTKRKTPDDA